MEYRYKALRQQQTPKAKPLVMFSAPAAEIASWVGVPQKTRFGTGEETVGFQREENRKRVDSLSVFCSDDLNVIQNPLLCARRKVFGGNVVFFPLEGSGPESDAQAGTLVITTPDYGTMAMSEILRLVREFIEERVPELAGKMPSDSIVAKYKVLAVHSDPVDGGENAESLSGSSTDQEQDAEQAEEGSAVGALFEESHILDFWQEVAGRHEVIKLLEGNQPVDEFLGFSRSALVSYLRPVVLVDGQHRLRGAIAAAERRLEQEEIVDEIEERVGDGEAGSTVHSSILARESRRLPISLLLDADPAEQVFQFVVVNQKATPIGRALLGTIVSTTLSAEEMNRVATRLRSAGIELEESQAVTYLARHPSSPFSNLVERGMSGDSSDLLQWNVFAGIVSIFRNLKGAKLYGFKNDYADVWRSKYLGRSAIVAGENDAFTTWQALDGPWREVFITFYSKLRDELGTIATPDAHNFWGSPRTSNLFNKISLTILTADFFEYLCASKSGIDSAAHVKILVDGWLDEVNREYFARDWQLSGVKKDSVGIRNQWASQWNEYRKSPVALPQSRMFRTAKKAE